MRAAALALAALALMGAAPVTHHATGTFEVKITSEGDSPALEGGLPTARMGLAKTFSGGMTGTAIGTMLSAGVPKPGSFAAYVALDQFHGTVDGKAGGFLLLHRATMTKVGGGEFSVTIAEDSGTGALAGIQGTLAIEIKGGVHHYDLSYTLP